MADPSYPEDLLYHPEHDWARVDGEEATFGITWFAQDSLGEVVFFDPPKVGTTVSKDAPYTEIESVKAVAEVYTPVAENSAVYDELYAEYVLLHDYFGRGGNDVLHRLRALRDRIIEANPGDDADVDTTSGALDNEAGDS